MKTTILGRTGIETGVLGLGLEHLEKASFKELAAIIEPALEAGVRYLELICPGGSIRSHLGRLMQGRRDRFQIQGHIGACLAEDGQYMRSWEPERAERHAEDLLRRLDSDYVDTLMVHFVDELEDWAQVSAPGGVLEIALRWKEQGKARAVGMSSHKVGAARAAVESGLMDILMFPVNPAFDLLPDETKLEALWEADPYTGLKEAGSQPVSSRRDLFLTCQREGVAIVAMKPYAGGWVFWPENPSGIVLSPVQCLQYTLSQPGVCVAVPGVKTPEEVQAALAWLNATEEEKDYSLLLGKTDWNLDGSCMYCNHCLPCPAGIDIAATIRLFDAARRQGVSAALAEAYNRLPAPASACLFCGECEPRCPFEVAIQANMEQTAALFEK